MSNSLYDTQEYIKTVMRIENCSREEALKLIEDFKAIDERQDEITKEFNRGRFKAYRERWRAEGKCQCCGKVDGNTLLGFSRCERCSEYQKEYNKKRKNRNATNR